MQIDKFALSLNKVITLHHIGYNKKSSKSSNFFVVLENPRIVLGLISGYTYE